MLKPPLYTIGHGARKSDEFIDLLLAYHIKYLVDVRSVPSSRYHPHFKQVALKASLKEKGIVYVYMGDQLGGRPQVASCYDDRGHIDFEKVKNHDFFKQGIERLKTAYLNELSVAVMCSERDPCQCHRSRLIANALLPEAIVCEHIDEKGRLKNHHTLLAEMDAGRGSLDFG